MAGKVPEHYVDGCTVGPQGFGTISHVDICNEHDRMWWENRKPHQKVRSDWIWGVRIIKRHASNGWWVLPAIFYAVVGFVVLNTGGWYWWVTKK